MAECGGRRDAEADTHIVLLLLLPVLLLLLLLVRTVFLLDEAAQGPHGVCIFHPAKSPRAQLRTYAKSDARHAWGLGFGYSLNVLWVCLLRMRAAVVKLGEGDTCCFLSAMLYSSNFLDEQLA